MLELQITGSVDRGPMFRLDVNRGIVSNDFGVRSQQIQVAIVAMPDGIFIIAADVKLIQDVAEFQRVAVKGLDAVAVVSYDAAGG